MLHRAMQLTIVPRLSESQPKIAIICIDSLGASADAPLRSATERIAENLAMVVNGEVE